MKNVPIRGAFIALGQFLKFADVVPSGGEARSMLESGLVTVNGELEQRRGRKLYPGDVVTVSSEDFHVAGSEPSV